jgi:PAS domain S-box-containing protein
MSIPLKLLIAEDNPADAELLLFELRRAGFEPSWQRVETESRFLELVNDDLDIVLSDFQMPDFNGLRALELLKRKGLDVPFVLVSGTIGEDVAVLAMKHGAADYLLKDRLVRLGPAVVQALGKRRLRREQLRLAEAEQRQQAELRVLFDIMPAMIWFKDTEDRILRVNQSVAKSSGIAVSDIEGKLSSEIYPQDSAAFLADDMAVIRSGVANLGIVETLHDQEGKEIWVQTDKVPVFGKDGKVIGIVVMAQDITERKRSEEALRESEERFSEAFEHAPIGVALLSLDGRWLKVNRALCDLVGYSEAEMLASAFHEITYRGDLDASIENIRTIAAGKIHSYEMEKRYVHRQGHIITVLMNVSLVHDRKGLPSYLVAQIQDITNRRVAEKALADLLKRTAIQERLLNTALSSMSDFAQVYDRSGRLLFANQSLLNLWGLRADEAVGKNFYDLQYPGELARKLHAQLEEVFAMKKPITDEIEFIDPKGEKGYYEYIFSPVFASDGTVDLVVGSTRDVTARKHIEQSLRTGKAELAVAQRIAHLGSWELELIDPDVAANPLRWSDEMFRIAGFEPGDVEVNNKFFFSIVPPEDHEPIRQAISAAIIGSQNYSIVHRLVRADGAIRTIKETGEIFLNEMTKMPSRMVGIAQDITERRLFEEQIRQSQKMDAIGTLAGGIAHDFNNILTAIIGYTELAKISVPGSPLIRKHLEAVLLASNRAAALVRQILTFSRQESHERRAIKLRPIVAETFDLLRSTVPSTIEFDITLATNAPSVFADPTQIHQILMNLGTNAWHAMKDSSGRLQVKLEKIIVDERLAATTQSLHTGSYARITVSDTGCGMDQETLQRIFEPFFTTKPTGEGTGLGLAVVHGIIDSHDGAITVESSPGVGTTFQVYLPEYLNDAQASLPEAPPVGSGRGERILVVDDEELLARLGEQTLTTLGYQVEFATQPSAALALVRSDPRRFSLIVTDQTMPGMTGLLLAAEVRKIRSDLPIILMTGHDASISAAHSKANGIFQVLLKPTNILVLGAAVHAALASHHNLEAPGEAPVLV